MIRRSCENAPGSFGCCLGCFQLHRFNFVRGVHMRSKLKALIKQNKILYRIYFCFGSLFLRLIGIFFKTDPDLVLFISYGGQKYDDSPRAVYEYLQKHPISSSQRLIWAFTDPNEFPQITSKVKVDTLRYYIMALRAGFWITNSSASRGLNFKKKRTKNILFQHGLTGIKKSVLIYNSQKRLLRLASTNNLMQFLLKAKKRFHF